MRRLLGFLCIAAMMAPMPAAVALPDGPEEIMIQGQINVLATFVADEDYTNRRQLILLQDGGIGLYHGVMASGYRSCTANPCSDNACHPFTMNLSSRFDGDDFVIDFFCSFAGQPYGQPMEWRWSPASSPSIYNCSGVAGPNVVEQTWIGRGGHGATLRVNGEVRQTCALLVVDGVGRFSADWHVQG